MTPIFNFCPIAPACARLSYVAIVVHGSNSSFAVFHSGLRLVFPPVQSKIASFSSLTLRSQRRSSIVAPAVLLVASPWAHSGWRLVFPPVQSKIASFSSLTLRSQRRSSIVAPAVLLVASPWAHSGLRVYA